MRAQKERRMQLPGSNEPVRELVGDRLDLPEDGYMTVPGLLQRAAETRSSRVALRAKKRGIYRAMNWKELLSEVSRIALGFRALGVERGSRVAIIGDPSAEWLLADLAAQCIGAVSYGLYPTSSLEEVEFVLQHGGARVLVAEDQEHVDKVLPVADRLPNLRKIIVIDDSNMFDYTNPTLIPLIELVEGGCQYKSEDFFRLCNEVHPDDFATIVYTSGTSANPKGAIYTHRSLVAQGHQFFDFPEFRGRDDIRAVVHLPLNHLYERMNTPMGMLVKGIVPHFGDEVGRFMETLSEVLPQHHASVPRYWSKLASRIIVGIENSSPVKRLAYRLAMSIGQAYRRRRWAGHPAPILSVLYWMARIVLFDRMLKKLGLNCLRVALSAGAALPVEVQTLWQIWGVNLKNLYGQTEGGVITAQFGTFPRPGTVGKPYRGVVVRIGPDDEIITTSPGSFNGYWQDAKASGEVLQSDGIRTGDIGTIDASGDLVIVDRKKDIVITAGGKNVSPTSVETVLKSSPYISEANVIGEGRKYLTALIELDVGTVSEWARANNILYGSYKSLATNPEVYSMIAREIERANGHLGRVEQIKAFRILDRELDPEVEGEAITATRKIKRAVLHKHFGHLISEMYSDDEERRVARQLTTVQ